MGWLNEGRHGNQGDQRLAGLKRSGRCLLAAGVMLTLTACGTFFGRASETSPGVADYYKGSEANLILLGVLRSPGSEMNAGTIVCYMVIVCPIITVVSLPVDVAVDTALLPVDFINTRIQSSPPGGDRTL